MRDNIVPMYTWIDGLTYEFKIPMTLNGMKDIRIRTTTFGGKNVWANTKGNKFSKLPMHLSMKDIIFGVIYKGEKEIDWYDSQQTLDSNDIDSFCFKGKAIIDYHDYENTYNPYAKYNSFQLNTLLNNDRVQSSLWRTVEQYKNNGQWEDMRRTKRYIQDITSRTSIKSMWKILTKDLSIKDFIVPNPAISLKIVSPQSHPFNGQDILQFLFTNKVQTEQQTLTKWVKRNPAAKPIESVEDWTDFIKAYESTLEDGEELIESDPFVDTPF